MTTPAIKVLYINTGSGHRSQATAIVDAAKNRGIDAEIVNFSEVAAPSNKGEYEKAYGEWLKSDDKIRKGIGMLAQHVKYHLLDTKRDLVDKFVEENKDSAIILAHPHLQRPFSHIKKKIFVLHTDPVKWPLVKDTAAKGERVHLATKNVLDEIDPKSGIEISGVPVNPDIYKKAPDPFEKKEFSVVVAAGGDGPEIADITKKVLESKLPSNTIVHAVAGRNKQDYKELKRLSKTDPRIRAYGFTELKPMFQNADLNVVRTHGTTFAETVLSGKPAVYYGPEANITDPQAALTTMTAQYGHDTTGNPVAVGLDQIPGAVNSALRRYERLSDKAVESKKEYGNPASDIAKLVVKTACRFGFLDEMSSIRKSMPLGDKHG